MRNLKEYFNYICLGLIILFIASVASYNLGSSRRLSSMVDDMANSYVDKISDELSASDAHRSSLVEQRTKLRNELSLKNDIISAQQEYLSEKNNCSSQINSLTAEISRLNNEIQAASEKLGAAITTRTIPQPKSSNIYYAETSPSEIYVWVGKTGNRYHKSTCHTLKGDKYQITLKEAQAKGRTPCGICGG